MDVLDDYTCSCLSNHVLGLLDGAVSNSLPTTNAVSAPALNPYTLSYKVNHLPWLEGMVTWWPLDVDGSDIFGGLNGLLLGDVAFSTGATNLFSDDFDGPFEPGMAGGVAGRRHRGRRDARRDLCRRPQLHLRHARRQHGPALLNTTLNANQRRGWSSATIFNVQDFRYEARFNTLSQGSSVSTEGFLELWILDAADTNLLRHGLHVRRHHQRRFRGPAGREQY